MKKVGIDARLYFQTGIGTYLQNLIFQLEKIAPSEFTFYIYVTPQDADDIHFANRNFIKKPVSSHWHSISEQIFFLKTLYQDNLDLMHFTYFSSPILYRRKFIATIHDATPLLFKTGKASTKNPLMYFVKHLSFQSVLANQVKNAQAIITPTKTVKKQLIKIYGQQYEAKIYPVYEGVNESLANAKENTALKNKYQDFFIYVGNFYPHKNVERLIEAFTKVKTKSSLILIGPNDYFAKRIVQSINRLDIKNKVILYPNATKKDLVFFYKNAKALIHPSLSEGFGLPIVEAAYFDCPIIASDIEVFQELLDHQYLSFNPYDVNDMTDKINEFTNNPVVFDYQKMLKKYSFKKMTKETLEIYCDSLAINPVITV